MTVSGSGTSGDPFVVFGSVKLDPSVDNILDATVNGLFLDCAAVQACVGGLIDTPATDTPTINMTITGDGTVGNEYVITASVKLSATAGNLITSDGTGIYLSCAQVRGCLSAGDGLNYNSATGVFEVQISADAGNMTVIGTDGGVYTPPGAGVFTDCGLDGLGTLIDPLVVNTGGTVWPWACDEDQGAAIYCSTVDGAIRTDPEKFVIYQTLLLTDGTDQTDNFATAGSGLTVVGGPVSVVINNPSLCRDMLIITDAGVEHASLLFQNTGRNDVSFGANVVVVGDIVDAYSQAGHQRWATQGQHATDFNRFDTQRSSTRKIYTLIPGGSATFSLYSDMNNFNYNGSALMSNWTTYLDIIGFSGT